MNVRTELGRCVPNESSASLAVTDHFGLSALSIRYYKPNLDRIYKYLSLHTGPGAKVKGKGRFMGLLNTAAVRPIVFLPPTSFRIHLQRCHASYRCARPLPAKAGTITNEFCYQIRNSRKN